MDGGTYTGTMTNFIKSDPKLAQMFFDPKTGQQTMSLNLISNQTEKDEKNGGRMNSDPGHYVLDINNAAGGDTTKAQDGNSYNTVFDPYNREKGGSVVNAKNNPALADAYLHTNAETVPIANPSAPAPAPAP